MSFGLIITKTGADIATAEPKDFSISTQFDTVKILHTGELSLSLPAETLTDGAAFYEEAYEHGLGYIPFATPITSRLFYAEDLETGGDYIVNDLEEYDIPAVFTSFPNPAEYVTVFVDDNDLILHSGRYELLGLGQDFGARTVTLFYTLCYNEIGTAFNYL